MRILLIAPPYPLEQAPSPPLGLCYVAAACKAHGAHVHLLDFIVSPWEVAALKKELDDFKPDIIGLTSVTMTTPKAMEILKEAKRLAPQALTIMGGPHASFDASNLLTDNPELDLVILGEGEATLAELLPKIHDRQSWPAIQGLAFRDKDGKFVSTGFRPFIEDLDTLPLPARELLPISRYQALGFPVSIITSRGCPNGCIFCLGRKMVGPKVRHRSAHLVLDEIETLLEMGFSFINIADDLFTANEARVEAFCEEIQKRNLSFLWSVFSRVNTINRSMLEKMKAGGCFAVSFGIESGCEDMLKRVRKGITLDQAREAVKACKEVGMRAHASFMVGLPGETEESLAKTRAFQEELHIEYGYHFLCPFPGTRIRENVADYDLEILSSDWTLYDADSAIVRTSSVSPARMESFVTEACASLVKSWEESRTRVEAGEGTEAEELQILGHRRTMLIFALLSRNLIEKTGMVKKEDALEDLAEKIAEFTDEETSFVRFVLKDLWEKRLLSLREEDGKAFWCWTSNQDLGIA